MRKAWQNGRRLRQPPDAGGREGQPLRQGAKSDGLAGFDGAATESKTECGRHVPRRAQAPGPLRSASGPYLLPILSAYWFHPGAALYASAYPSGTVICRMPALFPKAFQLPVRVKEAVGGFAALTTTEVRRDAA